MLTLPDHHSMLPVGLNPGLWAGSFANILKLLPGQTIAVLCSGVVAQRDLMGDYQRYDNFESGNVNNLQSCLVWICLSLRGEL